MKAVLRARTERVLGVRRGREGLHLVARRWLGAGLAACCGLAACWTCTCLALRNNFHSACQCLRFGNALIARPSATPATPAAAPWQDLNPLPFPALVANCAGWVAYGYVTDDVLVLWPNMAGYLLALFYTFSWWEAAAGGGPSHTWRPAGCCAGAEPAGALALGMS